MDAAGRMIAIIIAVVMVVLQPLPYIAQIQGEAADNIVSTLTEEFTDTARHQGYVTKQMYEDYTEKLALTGDRYDVEMKVAEPVDGKKLAAKDNKVFNTSIDSKSSHRLMLLGSTTTHVHTDACYDCIPTGDMNQLVTISLGGSSQSTGGGNSTSSIGISIAPANYPNFNIATISITEDLTSDNGYNVRPYYAKCIITVNHYPGNQTWQGNNPVTYTMTASSSDPNLLYYIDHLYSRYRSAFIYSNPDRSGYGTQTSYPIVFPYTTISDYSYSVLGGIAPLSPIPYTGDTYGTPLSYKNPPICDRVVTSLTPTNPTQTVTKGDSIITTATATYLDGHTAIINCNSNYNPSQVGNQIVTLSYSGLVDNAKTTGTKTCTINVTVQDNKLTGITATPASQNIKRYANPAITVKATYSDGSSKAVNGYTISGFSNSILGAQTATISYTEGGITKTAVMQITVTKLTTICPICGAEYELDENDVDNGCPVCAGTIINISASPTQLTVNKGGLLDVVVTATYRNGKMKAVTGWTSDYNANLIGLQMVTISYGSLSTTVTVNVINNMKTCPICGVEYELNDDGTDPGCPYCAKEVTSITASPKDITIGINDPLSLTVIATYRDGHTATINDWYTNFTPDTTGTYDVTVFYKSQTDTIHVTVVNHRLTCPYCGLEYDYTEYPDGCPVCSTTLTDIKAKLRNGGTQVTYGSDLSLEITLVYRDTHTELTYTGWTVSGYWPTVEGEQTITVNYGGLSTSLTIDVVRNHFMVTCPVCGTQYYLNDDGSDPGCPVCSAEANEEESVLYFDVTYSYEILDALYKNGIYGLKEGDYFSVTITAQGDSVHKRLQRLLPSYRRSAEDMLKEWYTSGGEVTL